MPRISQILRPAVLSAVCLWLLLGSATSQVNVTTYHNDNARTGQNSKEIILTPQNVNSGTFGKLFSHTVDSYVYAQPLYLANVTIPGKGVHNVVYVATQHDSIYAFDADRNTGAAQGPLWRTSFINPAAGIRTLSAKDTRCGDVPPEIGITGTPVINPTTRTLYVVVRTNENGVYYQRLHAIDASSGHERAGSPVVISAAVSGTGVGSVDNQITFDPLQENQRAGLLLQNNLIYISWGSQCDIDPYHGWIMAYDVNTLRQRAVWISTPDGEQGAIWQGGAAPAGDSLGNVYFTTGNGTFDLDIDGNDYGDSIVKLGPVHNGTVAVADYFTPFNQAYLQQKDQDLGAGGPVLLPDNASKLIPHLMVQIGKSGTLYLVNRDNMGGYNTLGDTQIVQSILKAASGYGAWMTPVWWNSRLYISGGGDVVKSYLFHANTGKFALLPSSAATTIFNFPGSTPSLSSNGPSNGILWALQEDAAKDKGPAVLHAYDALNLANELYNTNQNLTRDNPGNAVKFAVPTIANGKVYVGGEMTLAVFGLLPVSTTGQSPADPNVEARAGSLSNLTKD